MSDLIEGEEQERKGDSLRHRWKDLYARFPGGMVHVQLGEGDEGEGIAS